MGAAGQPSTRRRGVAPVHARRQEGVLVDPVVLCGGRHPGYNCSNRGSRLVRVYALTGNAWRRVLSNETSRGTSPQQRAGKNRPEGEELNARSWISTRATRVSDPTGSIELGAVV